MLKADSNIDKSQRGNESSYSIYNSELNRPISASIKHPDAFKFNSKISHSNRNEFPILHTARKHSSSGIDKV